MMTSPPSASKSVMGSSRRLSREPGQGAWAPPRQHAGNSRWPCLNSHANGHDNGRQHASGMPRCSWPERDLAQHSATSPRTCEVSLGQYTGFRCVRVHVQQLIASRVHSQVPWSHV